MATVATVNELGSYAHNPRGNLWLNDDSSYGKKLLLKMGWKKGKGLGKKEDGIKENLKVKFRDTNSGLGFKDDSYNNVMKTEYESILQSLRDEYPQQKSVNVCNKNVGPENKDIKQSKIVKNRIRYPKLYYAKDVSRYSEKDMRSIFICSLPIKNNEEEESKDSGLQMKEDAKNSRSCVKKESENHLSKSQDTSYASHLSISDYFNMKMKEKKDKEQKKHNNMKEEETDSCSNKINYEIKETESDCQNNKQYKVKEEKSNPEYIKTDCEIDQEQNGFQFCMAEDIVSNPNGKKHKRKRKHSKINDDKNLSPLIEKDVINPIKKQKELAEDSVCEGTVCEEKMHETDLMPDQLSVSHKKRKSHKKKGCNSSANTMESSLCQSNVHTDMPVKKRKKSHRNDNIYASAIGLHFVTSPKDEVSTNSELVNNLTAPSLVEVTGESLTVDNNSPRKKQKKFKNKLKKLKSCLKSKRGEYVVKNVSFNENVSYQFIDSENESSSSLTDCQNEIQRDFEISASHNNPEQEKDSGDNKTEVEGCDLKELDETSSNISETVSEEKSEKCNSLSSLPSSNSSYYNSWVESQQQALRMKLYKDLLNGITKHDVFKTTNLLFIKGYGNWGF